MTMVNRYYTTVILLGTGRQYTKTRQGRAVLEKEFIYEKKISIEEKHVCHNYEG